MAEQVIPGLVLAGPALVDAPEPRGARVARPDDALRQAQVCLERSARRLRRPDGGEEDADAVLALLGMALDHVSEAVRRD